MGHATRVRQVSHHLHQDGHNVSVAASSSLLGIFDDSVCSRTLEFSSIRIRYSSILPQYLAILIQAPLLLIQFLSDHYRINRIVKKHNIDIVISDNRFGAWTGLAYSVYITHQLTIKAGKKGIFESILSRMHRFIAGKYNECWIPDIENGLAGDLTLHPGMDNTRYIGILSMLKTCEAQQPEGLSSKDYYAVIVSGPEPQRSILTRLLIRKFSDDDNVYVIAGGKESVGVLGRGSDRVRGREGESEGVRERGSVGVVGERECWGE